MTAPPRAIGRLALREEGEFWNAYYAEQGTMEGAILLGSLRMSIANDRACKQRFMELMTGAVGAIIKGITGIQPTWNAPTTAPEHERSGKA